jgi:ribosome-binding protein aMBF1 (putative translation factor)
MDAFKAFNNKGNTYSHFTSYSVNLHLVLFFKDNKNMSDLGKRVQELRKQKGLTQAQLAEKINISHT